MTVPRSARLFGAGLGIAFIGMAVTVVLVSTPLSAGPALGALAILIVGLDLLVSAIRNRWSLLASVLFLP